jgi:UDP-N-acetylglucosamine acyltransferase
MLHSSAIISPEAHIGERVTVGPYTVIDAGVSVGDDCRIGPQVYLTGDTQIGARCRIHKGVVLGDEPQDFSYDGSPSGVRIGEDCAFREYVTVHRGSKSGQMTTIGDRCMLMAFSHVGHDCQLGDDIVMANNSLLSGHVEVEDKVTISAWVGIHQFCRIGTMAMIGGKAKVNQDVPPYCLVNHDGEISGVNLVGLRRNGFTSGERIDVSKAFKLFFRTDQMRTKAIDTVATSYPTQPAIVHFVEHVLASKRGILPGVVWS